MLSLMEQHTGKRPVIYTDITFHRDVMEGELAGYDFWLRSVAAEPEARYRGRPWTFWQYTATGRVPGIEGDVDRNAFHGSEKEWKRWVRTGR
jgi:lysozyme